MTIVTVIRIAGFYLDSDKNSTDVVFVPIGTWTVTDTKNPGADTSAVSVPPWSTPLIAQIVGGFFSGTYNGTAVISVYNNRILSFTNCFGSND